MSAENDFLSDQLARHDAALVRILEARAPQQLRARLLKIYSARKGLQGHEAQTDITFVHAGSSWGNTPLAPGELGLVFLDTIAGSLYEAAWNGHLLVHDVDGRPHAVYKHKELWLDPAFPSAIRAHACQDPERPYASAIEFDALETYLRERIALAA
jgi:hypothetical protein